MIQNLLVPAAVPSSSGSAVVLDCDYTLEPSSDQGLVVKWFFNDYPNPVYQWIYGRKPQDHGILKKRVNLDYQASQDPKKMYRAMKIESPTKELSGVYKCHVSTFEDEATEQRKMVVYTPAKRVDLKQETKGDEVTLKCTGIGVYPEPNMTIYSSEQKMNFPVTVETISKEGLYNIEAKITFQNKDLPNPTTFDCILHVPEANYTVQESMYYYPTPRTTAAPYRTTERLFWGEEGDPAPTHYDPDLFFIREGANSSVRTEPMYNTLLLAIFSLTLLTAWL